MQFKAFASSSQGNLYTLEEGTTSLLIECGLGYRAMQKVLPKAPTNYDACLISHSHGDHCDEAAAGELIRRGVSVMFGGAVRDGKTIGRIRVRSFEVRHDVPNWGFMFLGASGESCVFVIDTFFCPVRPTFSPTIIAIEANWARDLMRVGDDLNDRLFSSHMSLAQCIKTLQAWDLSSTREVHLLHLSDERSDEQRFVSEVQGAIGIPTYIAPKMTSTAIP